MQQFNINKLIEFKNRKFNPVVLLNAPDLRLMLLCLRAGQQVPEHSAAGHITVQAITGRATFYDGNEPCEMFAGTLIRLEAGRPHHVEAHQDSALLITIMNTASAMRPDSQPMAKRELDLREIPRPQRHALVFAAFDALAVGESFTLINDHDPVPLRAQIEQMREGEMGWEYIERGPENFRIRVSRIAPAAGNVGPVNTGTTDSPVSIG